MNKHNLNIDENNQNINNDDQNAYVEGDFGEVSGDGNINYEGVDVRNSGANSGDDHIDDECDNNGASSKGNNFEIGGDEPIDVRDVPLKKVICLIYTIQDIGIDLYVELKLLVHSMPKEKLGPMAILQSIKHLDCFPNTTIAYRILLTNLVTASSAERSFSKLKLIKTYLCSIMSQKRPNGIAMISIEHDMLKTIDYKDLIEEFASKKS
nr:zinc finger MYM-type protein 1-like [Tanacetum cinerariifolium]